MKLNQNNLDLNQTITNISLKQIVIIIFIFLVVQVQPQIPPGQYCFNNTCFNCYFRCDSCSGPSSQQCLTCNPMYVLKQNTCQSCGQNCISCSSNSNVCQSCAPGFYLTQSTGECSQCSIGASACTFAAIQSCKGGFYLSNSVCNYCPTNCQICQDINICKQCKSGYFISNNQCQSCMTNCISCSNTVSCNICKNGYTGVNCVDKCPLNCDICSGQICYQCSSSYYNSGKGCIPLSILCSQGDGLVCFQCQSYAFLSNSICLPYDWIGYKISQSYYTALNNKQISKNLVLCDNGYIYSSMNNIVTLNLTINPSSSISIKFQIVFSSNKTQFNISSSNLNEQYSLQSLSILQSCKNTFDISKYNYDLSFTSKGGTDLNLIIKSQFSIGISQILIVQTLCQISYCNSCLSPSICYLCIKGYFLQNNKCLISCSDGYYSVIDNGYCVLNCPDGYYAILSEYKCQKCISPCNTCTSPDICSSCVNGTYLTNNKCQKSCPQNTYANNDQLICKYCRFPCKNCMNSVNCTSCSLGYLQPISNNLSLCDLNCPSHYFTSISTLTCQLCNVSCYECLYSSDVCSKCYPPSVLSNNKCVSDCPLNYYNLSSVCIVCYFPCQTCQDKSICNSCISGYLYSSSCLNQCPSGSFKNQLLKLCQNCTQFCKQCQSLSKCKNCITSYYYYNYQCFKLCPLETYSSSNYTCRLCKSPCLTCSSSTQCLSCVGSFLIFHNGQCIIECPQSFYLTYNQNNSKICQNCQQSCTKCINNQVCLACSTLLYLGNCVLTCPNSTYRYDDVCLSCLSPCQNCQGYNLCLSCVKSFYYFQQSFSCVSNCPFGYYGDLNVCKICDIACLSCIDNSNKCLQCSYQYYRNTNGSCVSSCSKGYYPSNMLNKCMNCPQNCITCFSNSVCLSCNTTSTKKYYFSSNCLSSCPDGYYADSLYLCQICDSSCKSCQINSANCSRCAWGLSLYQKINITVCVSLCPSGSYSNENICVSCPFQCKQCLSAKLCTSCKSSYSYYLDNCMSICPFGFTSSSHVCVRCQPPCRQCVTSSTNCTTCMVGSYLSGNNCVKTCPLNKFAYPASLACLDCESPCLSCLSKVACSSCIYGYYLLLFNCVSTCPNGYYSYAANSTCLRCNKPCDRCLNETACKSCIKGYILSYNTCVSSCAETYYISSSFTSDLQCAKCKQPCYSCSDVSTCLSCNTSSSYSFLQQGTCLSNCLPSYYAIGNQCKSCDNGCVSCTGPSKCKSCLNSYLMNGTCLSVCPLYTFGTIGFTCQYCLSPCLQCFSQGQCKSCVIGMYLYLTHCLKVCPSNLWIYPDLQQCNQKCEQPRYKDQNNKNCLIICPLYYLQNGDCVFECPSGYKANKTLGCQQCDNECQQMFKFMVASDLMDGFLRVNLIFNYPIDEISIVNEKDIIFNYKISNAPSKQQLTLSALRNLQQIDNFTFDIITRQKYKISCKVKTNQISQSGILFVNVTNLSKIKYNSLPLQINYNELNVQTFKTVNQAYWAEIIAQIISSFYLLSLLLGILLGQLRPSIIAAEGLFILHTLFYLDFWSHPAVNRFILGLQLSIFRFNFPYVSQSTMWNCSTKYIFVFNGCSLFNQLVIPLLVFTLLICISLAIRFINYLNQGQKQWSIVGKLYMYWWIVLGSPSISVVHYLLSQKIEQKILSLVTSIFISLITLFVCFHLVKNVYNHSYAERSFFWKIKRSSGRLSGLQPLLTVIRRFFLIFGGALGEEIPLTILFITGFITIYYLGNLFISNQRYRYFLITKQIILGIIILLFMFFIANGAALTSWLYDGLGWILFVLVLSYSGIIVGFSLYINVKNQLVRFRVWKEEKELQKSQKQKSHVKNSQQSGQNNNNNETDSQKSKIPSIQLNIEDTSANMKMNLMKQKQSNYDNIGLIKRQDIASTLIRVNKKQNSQLSSNFDNCSNEI